MFVSFINANLFALQRMNGRMKVAVRNIKIKMYGVLKLLFSTCYTYHALFFLFFSVNNAQRALVHSEQPAICNDIQIYLAQLS